MSRKRYADEIRDLVEQFEQAIWSLAAEHECGWNEDNCRPRMQQEIEERREAIVTYTMKGIYNDSDPT